MTTLTKTGAVLCALVLATLLAACGHAPRHATGATQLTAHIPSMWHKLCISTPTTWYTGSGITARQVSAACETVVYTKYLGPRATGKEPEPLPHCRIRSSEAGIEYYYVERTGNSPAKHVSFGIVEGEEPSGNEEAQLADFRDKCGPLPDEMAEAVQ